MLDNVVGCMDANASNYNDATVQGYDQYGASYDGHDVYASCDDIVMDVSMQMVWSLQMITIMQMQMFDDGSCL